LGFVEFEILWWKNQRNIKAIADIGIVKKNLASLKDWVAKYGIKNNTIKLILVRMARFRTEK
jgi:hypothetical protein